jgi:putative hydrolase of the HAD superfamily
VARGILFDLDETLLDRRTTLLKYASDLYSEFEASTKLDREEYLRVFEGLDGNGRTVRDQFFFGLATLAFDGLSYERLEEHFYGNAWLRPVLFPGVVEALTALREEGTPIGVVTNGREISQTAKIYNSDVCNLVDAYVISESFGARKPRPAIFEHISAVLRITARESWHVGDDPVADIVGASAAGFKTAWLERHLPWPDYHPKCYDQKASHVSEVVNGLVAA